MRTAGPGRSPRGAAALPVATIVVPTRDREGYLDVTLASVVPQARAARAEVLVVIDGPGDSSAAVAARHGVRMITLPARSGPNAARNAGVAASQSDLVVFIDDDIEAPAGWLDALLAAAAAAPDHDVLGGPIRARLEGGGPRTCGREPAPITNLDRGPEDTDVEFVWSANMTVRRRALEAVGPFDERLAVRGDEEDWQRRYRALGGRTRYVAGAGMVHRRDRKDSTLRALSRASYRQGRAARRYDVMKGVSRASWHEARTLLGCLWHIGRRRCLNGLVMAAHASGRLREALWPLALPSRATDDFLSGESGGVWGLRATLSASATDAALDALGLVRAQPIRLRRAAARAPVRRVLILAVERESGETILDAALAELRRSRHEVAVATATVGGRGKFENLGRLLAEHDATAFDWLIVVDDDVSLPTGFLDRFIFLAERFALDLAQPAHRRRSNAAWRVTRRAPSAVVRETRFVEIGPVFAFNRRACQALLPFPPLRAGWGLELVWSATAVRLGLRQGIVDATPVEHRLRRVAAAYDRTAAIDEARAFLAGRRYVPAREAARTLVTHTHW